MEKIEDLQLNGLKIIQDDKKFMFGTDAVLLSKFASIKKNTKVLDIGTGTGIICFLMFGNCPSSHYTGIDIQPDMIEMANRSKQLNNITNIDFICQDLKEFNTKCTFDVVVSNPPYEKLGSGFVGGNDNILQSRYEVSSTLDDIVCCAKQNLVSNGKLVMIYKAERIYELCTILQKHNIPLKEIQPLQKNPNTPPRLMLIKAIKNANLGVRWLPPLYLQKEDNQ